MTRGGIILAEFRRDRLALLGLGVLVLMTVLAVIGPSVAPYGPREYLVDPTTGEAARLLLPSTTYLFGTTDVGHDVFTQVLYGARPALIVGSVSAVLVVTIGTAIGLLAGFLKGWVDAVLMRVVDVAYAMPFEPAALLLAVVLGPSTVTLIIAMVCLMWRTPARLARAQALSISQRPFVKAARCAGVGSRWIIVRHIAPNVMGVNLLYVPIAVGWAVSAQATVSFLGFGDPQSINWGSMLQFAFSSGTMRQAWWWTLAPGLAIVALVASTFLIARPLEAVINPQLRTGAA